MHNFYVQCPPCHKCFDPWDVDHFCLCWRVGHWLLLSLHLNLLGRLLLFEHISAKHCSDITLLCIDNQHLFLQHHAAISIPISGGKMDEPGYLPPQICIESHSSVNLCPVFIWRLIWGILNLLGRSLMVLCVVEAHMPLESPQGVAASAALTAGVSLVSTQQAGDWARVSMPARHLFAPTLLLQISTRILYSMLCWASVSRCSLGKCQTLTYIKSCKCAAVGP